MEQAGPVFKALKHYSLTNWKLSCNQVKHVLFEEDLFLPSNGIKPSLKMCTWWQHYTMQLKHSLVTWREVQVTPYINLQLSLNTLNKWEVLTWVTSWWTTTTSCTVVANCGRNCGSIYSIWSYSMVMFWVEHLDTRITWVTMNTGTFSLVPFWSILKFHNPFNLLVTQTTLDMHIGLNDFQSPTKTTKPKLESVSSAM